MVGSAVGIGVGLLIYVSFCLLTFDSYSRKKERTNAVVLTFIYIYYTLLTYYVLQIISDGVELLIQFLIFLVASAVICYQYYISVIKSRDGRTF